MKTIKYTLTIGFFIALVALSSCESDSSDPTISEIQQRLTDLQNGGSNWEVGTSGNVFKDGFDVTNQFNEFQLNIGNKVYQTVNGLAPVWEASGVWDFQDNNPNQIILDGVTLISLSGSDSNLILTFTADGVPTGGRTESVLGEYEFHLISE